MKSFLSRFFPPNEDPVANAAIFTFFLCIVAILMFSLFSIVFNPTPEAGTCGVCIHKCKPFAVSSCHLESEGVSCACDVEKRE